MNDQRQEIESMLRAGISQLNIDYDDQKINKLCEYLQLLSKWNATHNLTAIDDDPKEMITLHLHDSISILHAIKGSRVLDVGSGAGLPGIIIAIFFPDIQVFSIDTRGKKIQFQTLAASSIELDNFQPIQDRIEQYQTDELFDQIVSRAFSNLNNFIAWSKHLIKNDGEWLAMKGQLPTTEIEDLEIHQGMQAQKIEKLNVPNLEADRHLITIVPQQKS